MPAVQRRFAAVRTYTYLDLVGEVPDRQLGSPMSDLGREVGGDRYTDRGLKYVL